MGEGNQYSIASVERALQVMKLFNQNHREMTLTEISQLSGINKSSVLRILATMKKEGFVKYNQETKKYRLGIVIYRLACTAFEFTNIKDIAKPYLKKIANETECLVHLAIQDEGRVYVIDKIYSDNKTSAMELVSKIGGDVPVHCTGVGKVLAAFAEDNVRQELLSNCMFERYTDKTITNLTTFERLLSQIKQQGYCINDGEHEAFIKCVTYPIFNHQSQVVAAVSLTNVSQMMDEEKTETNRRKLKDVTIKISKNLGYLC